MGRNPWCRLIAPRLWQRGARRTIEVNGQVGFYHHPSALVELGFRPARQDLPEGRGRDATGRNRRFAGNGIRVAGLPIGSGRAAVPPSLSLLPEQFQPQLNLPGARGSRRDDSGRLRRSARCRSKYNRVWGIEVRVIEHVEEIGAELRAKALRQCESLRERQVQLGQSRSLQYVASHVAVGPIGRHNEGAWIEVSVRSTEN